MRFQQQRMKDASSNKFALTGGSDDEEGGLTHGGQPLGDIGEDGFGELPPAAVFNLNSNPLLL